jgi:hypothetical protein
MAAGGQTATIDHSANATPPAPSGFANTVLETRTTAVQDSPSVRPAVHRDGTVHGLYAGFRTGGTEVVVVRDDNWATGGTPFRALMDGDGQPGIRIVSGLIGTGFVGSQRVGQGLAIAVDPNNSQNVYIGRRDFYGIFSANNTPATTNFFPGTIFLRAAIIATMVVDTGNLGRVCQGTFRDKIVTIANSGICPLTIASIASSSPEFQTPQVLAFPLTIAPGTSLQVPIRLQPTNAGAKSATITISSSDPSTPVKLVNLTGETPEDWVCHPPTFASLSMSGGPAFAHSRTSDFTFSGQGGRWCPSARRTPSACRRRASSSATTNAMRASGMPDSSTAGNGCRAACSPVSRPRSSAPRATPACSATRRSRSTCC